jgi:hypothetical protein
LHPNELGRSFTYSSENNYVSSGRFANAPSSYLDYLFVNHSQAALQPVASEIVLNKSFPVQRTLKSGARVIRNIYLSDHFGVMTTYGIPRRISKAFFQK